MIKQMGFGSRAETKETHSKIVGEFEVMKLANENKKIKDILNILAERYGYTSGQAVRNVINNYKKKQKQSKKTKKSKK